ncbi:hypothetical protein OIU85_006806 [Salix viminalis]|uniref:Uncharacterized protein n=1 Tax=Salix viminalis TaxID=40686 RepID=A0A9Q0PMG1_SALVM|nr:hypothetical protein OIU85_006806 [Salix viminalis]
MLKQVVDSGSVRYEEVDVANLDVQGKRQFIESILKVAEEDNEIFIRKMRERTDRVGIVTPKIEVRFCRRRCLCWNQALPALVNVAVEKIEMVFFSIFHGDQRLLGFLRLFPSKKRVVNILHDVSGIVKPMRLSRYDPTRLVPSSGGLVMVTLKSHGFATCSEMIWKKRERNVNQTIADQVRLKCCKVKQAKRQSRNKVEFIYSTLRLKNEKQALIGSKF